MDRRQDSSYFASRRPFSSRSVIPLGSGFLVILATLFSVLFILSATLVFVNPDAGPRFRDGLNKLYAQQSGIALFGENIDVDVDEPSVTIRWSILGCGSGFVLPGSPKFHGSKACGAPAIPLEVFIGDSDSPIFTYDPESIPVNQNSGQYLITQAQVQFDVDLVLDVHDALFYPFDSYLVSTSLRATSSDSSTNGAVPIIGMPVIKHALSFTTSSSDTDIQITLEDGKVPGKHLEIQIIRPNHARVYAMLIFGINWALCHFACGIAFLAVCRGASVGSKDSFKQVAAGLVVLVGIPQLRYAMPDAPGFGGVLIDTIGYFPQMTLAGLSVIVLLLIAVKREMGTASGRKEVMCHRSILSTLPGVGISEDGESNSGEHWTRGTKGHSRGQSIPDYMLEQVLRVLDVGSELLRSENGIAKGSMNFAMRASTSSGRVGDSRSHLRSRSVNERRMA